MVRLKKSINKQKVIEAFTKGSAAQKSSRRVFQSPMKARSRVSGNSTLYTVTLDFESLPACPQKCPDVSHLS